MRHLGPGLVLGALLAACSGGGGGGGGTNPNAVLQTITVSPKTAAAIPGATAAFTASGHYDDGSDRDVTGLATWSAAPGSVATFPAGGTPGVATALADGTATVTAAVGAIQGTAQLTVTTPTFVSVRIDPTSATVAAGATVDLRCLARTDTSVEIDVTALAAWTTTDPLVATVSAGAVTGVKAGQADVGASFRGFDATPAHVTVQPATLAALVLDLPPALSLPVGLDVSARAYARYSDGTQVEVTPLATWTSSSPTTVAVSDVASSRGHVDPKAPGTGTVTASFGGKSASANVTVVADPVVFVLVEPLPYPLPAGVSMPLRATALHANGTSADVTAAATWTSEAAVVQVDAAGVATTVAPGIGAVHATYGGFTGTTAVVVTGAAIQELRWNEIQPVTIAVGTTYQPDVWLTYADGSTYVVSDQAEIVPADVSVAALDTDWWGERVVRGMSVGSTTVTARYAGQTATLALNVIAATSMGLTGPSAAPLGATVALRANTYATSAEGDVTELADWSSSAPQVISVSNTPGTKGQVTSAVSTGSAVVTATFAGMTATKTVTAYGPVQSIAITPAAAIVACHQYAQPALRATATMAGGQQVDVTDIATWWCDDLVAACWSGSVYGNAPGTTPVTASVGSVLGQGAITVVDEPDALAIRPDLTNVTVPVGHAVQLTAVDTWRYTYPPLERPAAEVVTWSSQTPSVADFLDPSQPGLLTGIAPGTTFVKVSAVTPAGDPLNGYVQVGVDTLQGLSITPVALAVGGSVTLVATGSFAGGTRNVLPLVAWSAADPTVLGLSPPRAYGEKVGMTDLTATLDSFSAKTSATVTAPMPIGIRVTLQRSSAEPGATLSATASLLFDSSDSADVTGLATWSSTNPDVASISGTPPVVTALAVGSAGISASWNGFTASATLKVSAPPSISQLDFYSPLVQAPKGARVGLYLTAKSAGVSSVSIGSAPVVASSDPAVATATSSDTYTDSVEVDALAMGSSIVTATYAGKTAVAVVDVDHDVGEIWFGFVNPRIFPLHLHQRIALDAREYSSFDIDVTDAVAWSSSAPAVVKVSSPGQLEAVGPGVAYVSATGPRSAASIAVPVAKAAIASVGVGGAAPMVPVGAEYHCRATASFDDGATLPVTSQVAWTSADETIAAFDPARPGVLVGKKAGVVRVQAQIDGKAGGVDVTVF